MIRPRRHRNQGSSRDPVIGTKIFSWYSHQNDSTIFFCLSLCSGSKKLVGLTCWLFPAHMEWEWVVPNREEDAVNKMERDAKQAEMTDVYPGNLDALPLIHVADLLSSPFSLLFSLSPSHPTSLSLCNFLSYLSTCQNAQPFHSPHIQSCRNSSSQFQFKNPDLGFQVAQFGSWEPSTVRVSCEPSRHSKWYLPLHFIIYHLHFIFFKKVASFLLRFLQKSWKRNRCSSHCQF